MKITVLILNGVAVGWFTRGAIVDAFERIHDWRDQARWAIAGCLCIGAVLLFF